MKEIITKKYGEDVYKAFEKDFKKLKDMGIEPTGTLGSKAQEYLNHKGETVSLEISQAEYDKLTDINTAANKIKTINWRAIPFYIQELQTFSKNIKQAIQSKQQ